MSRQPLKFCLIISSVFFLSCSGSPEYIETKDLENSIWLWNNSLNFEFEIEDASAGYDISYFIRSSANYSYQNLYIQHFGEDSAGLVLEKKLNNLILFDPKSGKPLGDGIGDINDVKKKFLTNYQFPYSGNFQIRFDQFMRQDSLQDILSVGIIIEKSQAE